MRQLPPNNTIVYRDTKGHFMLNRIEPSDLGEATLTLEVEE
jgi:hypothetical protein